MKVFDQIFSRDIKPGDSIAYDQYGNTDIVREIRLDTEDDLISILYEGTIQRRREMRLANPEDAWWGPLNGDETCLREKIAS